MRRKTFLYHEILPNGNYTFQVVKKPLPTYPYALRFKSYHDMAYYNIAKAAFMQSTKIPESCSACPIRAHCKGIYDMDMGTVPCRETWRKIWKYVNK